MNELVTCNLCQIYSLLMTDPENQIEKKRKKYRRFIQKGFCIEYLMCYPPHQYCQHYSCSSKGTLLGETSFSDASPVPRSTEQKDISTQDNHIHNTIQPPIICNRIQSIHPKVEQDIQQLVSKTEDKKRHDDLPSLLHRFHIIFDTTKHNIANTPINHVINTLPHSPPAQRPYPQPNTEESMYKICQEFLKAGLISEFHSRYAAPALLLKKSDGKNRLVIDYKKLNLVTIKDLSPFPNMENTIQKLGRGYKYFSKLDLKSGFYQIPIKEEDKEKYV
ncbi:unnamed protein product, partial [Didymodactylos carnosus]